MQQPIRHHVQEILLQGLQTLREQLPALRDMLPEGAADAEMTSALDQCIEILRPMQGLGVTDHAARLGALTHGLRAIVDGMQPYADPALFDFGPLPRTLAHLDTQLSRAKS